ncbi:MAG: CsiV family protein [Gammaproteobacteria bacterium]
MKKLASFLFFALLLANVQASDYQVEGIIFENLNAGTDNENWRIEGVLPSLPESIELISDAKSDEASGEKDYQYIEQPRAEYKLTAVYDALRVSSKYEPLMHVAWKQPALDHGDAEFVRLTLVEQSPDAEYFSDLKKLDGVIRIRSAHFLHADVHLLYLLEPLPVESENNNQSDLQPDAQNPLAVPEYNAIYAELKDTMRLKLNELYYFDHPAFGLIIRDSRIDENSDSL